MTWNRKKIIPIILGILVLGGCLRLFQLGEKSLWTDELVTIANAGSIIDIQSFLAHTRSDDLPKFYSLLFKYWIVLGTSEFTMRMLSVIFGCLLIPTTYALGRLFFDTKTSLCAALLTAVSPLLLIYDREIRMYSLFALLSSLSTYSFIRSLREERTFLWVLYAAVNLLNIYTHYYAFLVLAVQWLFMVIHFRNYKRSLKPWIGANIFLFLAFAVRLLSFIQDVAYHAPWALPRERFPFIYAKHFVDFIYIFFSLSVGQTILPWNPIAIIIFLSMLICLIVSVKKGLTFGQDQSYLVLLVFVPIVMGIIFRISMPRYFVFVAPIFFILIARGFWMLPRKITLAVALIMLLGWGYGIANYYQNKQFHIMAHVDPWRDVAQFLKENLSRDEEVLGVGGGVIPLGHYYGGLIPGFSERGVLEKVRDLDGAVKKRIWLIYTYQEEYEYWLKSREILHKNYRVLIEKKWVHDPDFELKKKLFRRNFAPYRIVATLYERKSKS